MKMQLQFHECSVVHLGKLDNREATSARMTKCWGSAELVIEPAEMHPTYICAVCLSEILCGFSG